VPSRHFNCQLPGHFICQLQRHFNCQLPRKTRKSLHKRQMRHGCLQELRQTRKSMHKRQMRQMRQMRHTRHMRHKRHKRHTYLLPSHFNLQLLSCFKCQLLRHFNCQQPSHTRSTHRDTHCIVHCNSLIPLHLCYTPTEITATHTAIHCNTLQFTHQHASAHTAHSNVNNCNTHCLTPARTATHTATDTDRMSESIAYTDLGLIGNRIRKKRIQKKQKSILRSFLLLFEYLHIHQCAYGMCIHTLNGRCICVYIYI